MKIQLLDPIVAQRIAAGEVIERPASVMRELLDNAIDANSTSIIASITEGGLEEITVLDDGEGIEKEDLPLCCESHATSKVRSFDDLYNLKTMGFRGEALYSIAAVSRITISSSFHKEPAFFVTIDNGRKQQILPGGPTQGTKITVEGLFKEVPARRQFLKRPSTEATMCKNLLLEKALAFPERSFKFYSDGQLKLELPATGKKQRILDALSTSQNIVPSEMLELFDNAGRFSLYALASSPAIFRSDRSHIKIYVNERPVEEYSLVQAVTYGYGELLPGGSFPYCYLFITVDPTLVDFNIHPTKREVKLRNKAEIHHQVVAMISSQVKRTIPRLVKELEEALQPELVSSPSKGYEAASGPSSFSGNTIARHPQGSTSHAIPFQTEYKPSDPQWFAKAKEALFQKESHMDMATDRHSEKEDIWTLQANEPEYIYIGQAFNLFLLAQKGDELFLVDQHAAHERILFDEIRAKKEVQALIIPVEFEVSRDVDMYLQENLDIYLNLGIKLERTADLLWKLWTIPAMFKEIEKEVVAFVQNHTGDSAEVEKGLYAIVSCHAAIKSGDVLDRTTAQAILDKVFAMEDPCCPHGRTFVIRLNKQELSQAVGRT
ncbi:DNA mismatch repair endonuclease MutL [uncultured Sphaerochaeta sp.]|uniref:DNA mismatch repair endonuclease MutL n=1 Tax=uncultured Sphaerochaeta sp. TaxID=886478 RepID=UPI002A0A2C5B|nr:DNA mismatch repair endonuclease MutL [uncultured Sphaerochaeta sp.]